MNDSFSYDTTRTTIHTDDARLNRLLLHFGQQCATVNEYAERCGIEPAEIMELLGEWLDNGTLSLEFWGDDVFVHTAPDGRPAPGGHADVPPNLWEQLRDRANVELAYALWRLIRNLERAGWGVETRLHRILTGLGPLSVTPFFAVTVDDRPIPTLVFPAAGALAAPGGLLSTYANAGAAAVGVICDEGALDDMVTAVRRWALSAHSQTRLAVLVLEAPRYSPTLLSPDDAAVIPVSVSERNIGTHMWSAGPDASTS